MWGLFGLGLAIVFGLGMVALNRGGFAGQASTETLDRFGEVPDFALINRDGKAVVKADLLGRVWVAHFIFTQCHETCPLSGSLMAQLQKTFSAADDVRLVSITVDPAHDTPAVLSAYASRLRAHSTRWLFLTGDKKHIYQLAQQGFHLGVYDVRDAGQTSQRQFEVPLRQVAASWHWVFEPAVAMAHHGPHEPQGTQGKVTQAIQHSDRLVLVDRQGRIRQYYDSKDQNALQRLERDVTRVLAES